MGFGNGIDSPGHGLAAKKPTFHFSMRGVILRVPHAYASNHATRVEEKQLGPLALFGRRAFAPKRGRCLRDLCIRNRGQGLLGFSHQ